MIVSLVVAVSSNGVIGRDGGMPWHQSSDLRQFKTLTLGKPVVMGRKTFQSIGRPLPGRPNVVITRDIGFSAPDVTIVSSLDAGLEEAGRLAQSSGAGEICVIGGGEIYRQAIDKADVLHVTHVEAELAGDTHFPLIDPALWERQDGIRIEAGERDTYPVQFVTYRRIRP